MLLYRLAPEGFFAAGPTAEELRWLYSDPFEVPPHRWDLGPPVGAPSPRSLVPLRPGKIVGIGRNYREHAAELANPVPTEPLLFLKPPSAVIGPGVPIVLPAESRRVDFEGEIAVVVGHTLWQADLETAAGAIFGITAACDVTARDLQQQDRTFTRAKGFDTFCPLGPAIRLGTAVSGVTVRTRINDEPRQQGRVEEMVWPPAELLRYVSHVMTLEPGDLVLTGTPAGVGPLQAGDRVEVEVDGVGVLANPVEARGS